jgi:hypothetical protein
MSIYFPGTGTVSDDTLPQTRCHSADSAYRPTSGSWIVSIKSIFAWHNETGEWSMSVVLRLLGLNADIPHSQHTLSHHRLSPICMASVPLLRECLQQDRESATR